MMKYTEIAERLDSAIKGEWETLAGNVRHIRPATATIRASAKVMGGLDADTFDYLNEQFEASRQVTRRYGREAFTWLEHPAIDAAIADPWAGTRYPRSVGCIDLARHLL